MARRAFGRQGQLWAAGGSARSEMARAAAGRAPGLQSRSGPAGLSQAYPARIPGPEWGPAPDRIPGHLFDRHRQAAGGGDLLFVVLAAAARTSLQDRARGGMLGAGA